MFCWCQDPGKTSKHCLSNICEFTLQKRCMFLVLLLSIKTAVQTLLKCFWNVLKNCSASSGCRAMFVTWQNIQTLFVKHLWIPCQANCFPVWPRRKKLFVKRYWNVFEMFWNIVQPVLVVEQCLCRGKTFRHCLSSICEFLVKQTVFRFGHVVKNCLSNVIEMFLKCFETLFSQFWLSKNFCVVAKHSDIVYLALFSKFCLSSNVCDLAKHSDIVWKTDFKCLTYIVWSFVTVCAISTLKTAWNVITFLLRNCVNSLKL